MHPTSPDLRARTPGLLAARIHCLLAQLPAEDPVQQVRATRSFSLGPAGDVVRVVVGVSLTGFDGLPRDGGLWTEGLYRVVVEALRSWGHTVMVVSSPVERLDVVL